MKNDNYDDGFGWGGFCGLILVLVLWAAMAAQTPGGF